MLRNWLFLALFALLQIGCSPTVYSHGVPNLAQIDAVRNTWRSGQPETPEAWAYIKSLGVKKVVKLNFDDEGSDQGARDAGMEVIYLPLQPRGDLLSVIEPLDATNLVTAVLALGVKGGTLIHCSHGQDRTGLIVGLSRVVFDGWTKHDAWKEMIAHHFHWELPNLMAFWLDFTLPPPSESSDQQTPKPAIGL